MRGVRSDGARKQMSAASCIAAPFAPVKPIVTAPFARASARPFSTLGDLPLVLMPHGGPWARDRLDFNPWVQYLAARGYAVFQPNFRGSWGFGETFLRSGDREWGRKMQDDLADGVKTLADQGVIDPARVCIVGASYGGYAALAGATLTPTAYKCAVSLAGISETPANSEISIASLQMAAVLPAPFSSVYR